jgi:hypothetical protein
MRRGLARLICVSGAVLCLAGMPLGAATGPDAGIVSYLRAHRIPATFFRSSSPSCCGGATAS